MEQQKREKTNRSRCVIPLLLLLCLHLRLLFFRTVLCAITVQWSFTAPRRGGKREREWEEKTADRHGAREREYQSVCKRSGTGASSPHPYRCLQSEECCISWGQCRGQGRGGSLLLRSPYSKHRAGLQTHRACGRQTEGDRWTDDASAVQWSPQMFSFTPSQDRSSNESFSHPKNCVCLFWFHPLDFSMIWCFCLLAVLGLHPSTATLIQLKNTFHDHIWHIKITLVDKMYLSIFKEDII